jgi:hypothetical protein
MSARKPRRRATITAMATAPIGRDPQRPANHGAALLLLGGAGVVAYLALKGHGGCGSCAATAPPLANGLYTETFAPGVATTWYVYNGVRYGVTTPAQLQRCFAGMPILGEGYFGNADTTSFIGTVQDISAGCPCPPGSTG